MACAGPPGRGGWAGRPRAPRGWVALPGGTGGRRADLYRPAARLPAAGRPGGGCYAAAQSAQVPKISTVWATLT